MRELSLHSALLFCGLAALTHIFGSTVSLLSRIFSASGQSGIMRR